MPQSLVEHVVCKQCKGKYWSDIIDPKNLENSRFRCIRCGLTFRVVKCSKCKSSKGFDLIQQLVKKASHFPNYRFTCRNCGRAISILLDTMGEQDLINLEPIEKKLRKHGFLDCMHGLIKNIKKYFCFFHHHF